MSINFSRSFSFANWSKATGGLLLVTLLTSCGGDDPMTQSQFCADKAARECDGVALNCLATPANCRTVRVTACMQFIAAQQPAATRPFRPERAGECLNATTATYMKPLITPADRKLMNDACEKVFAGSKPVTTPCTSTFECDANLICDRNFCTTRTVVTNGFCNNPGDVCPSGQTCVVGPDTRSCMVPASPVGQLCDDATNPCAPNLRCVGGACADRVIAGGSCTLDADCAVAAPYCDPYFGNTCDTGFIPSRGAPECEAFGATLASF